MPKAISWPHAPPHRLGGRGVYFVTAATYRKQHHFRTPERLDVVQRGLLRLMAEAGWQIEAWAVFSNHYHFIAATPKADEDASSLSAVLGALHEKTAKWVNRLDGAPGRKVWHNYRETLLSFEKSYLARLHYVHANPVHHGLVPVANQYRWCSAGWFERECQRSFVETVYRFKIDRVKVEDGYAPVVEA